MFFNLTRADGRLSERFTVFNEAELKLSTAARESIKSRDARH